MTACFVVQFGPLCMAAADTRISAHESGGVPAAIWDAADLPLTTAAGLNHVIPYRFRKIRQLNRGWAVDAGCHVTGDRMLNLLNREQAASADQTAQILGQSASVELTILENMPDVTADAQLYNSYLLGVPANLDRTGVWVAQLDRASGYAVSTAREIAMNWPLAIPAAERDRAQQAFATALKSMTHMADAVRAAAALIGAARAAPDCSAVVQIGLTWQLSPAEFQARYFHGHVDQIAAMTNDEIVSRWEVLPP